MNDEKKRPAWFRDALRKNSSTPAVWIGCALDFTFVLPTLLEVVQQKEAAWAAQDPAGIHGLLSVARSYTLLAGYAAENFVKGLWVAHALATGRNLDWGSGDGLVPSGLSRHNLEALAREAKFPLTEQELKQLKGLHRAIEWWAKYPIPKEAKDYELFGTGSGEAEKLRDLLRHLERLARAYCLNPEAPWPPDESTAEAGW